MKKNLTIKEVFKKGLIFVFSVVLITLTLLFISIYDTMSNYYEAVIKNYSQLLEEKNEQFVQIGRYEYFDGVNWVSGLGALTDTDTNEINQKLKEMGKIGRNIYKIGYDLGPGAGEIYLNKSDILEISGAGNANPYTYSWDELDIVEWDDFSNFFIDGIIGRMPEKNNEILISNRLAEFIMEAGIKPYGEDNYYKPTSFESLVTSDKYFHFGVADKVKIIGIINYDLSKYENLKNISWNEYNSNREKYWVITEELGDRTKNIYNKIFVNNEFIDHLIVNDESTLGTWKENKIRHTGILVMENTQDGFLNLLSEFKHDEPIAAHSTYSEYVDGMLMATDFYTNKLFFLVIILVILSAFLISKYVLSKQDVIELKKQKTKNLFVNKKYLWSIIPIAAISVILSSLISIFITKYFLPVIMGEDKINLNVFEISIRQFAVLFLSMIGIAMLSYLISIARIKIAYKKK